MLSGARIRRVQDLLRLAFAEAPQPARDLAVGEREHRRRQQRRVDRPARARSRASRPGSRPASAPSRAGSRARRAASPSGSRGRAGASWRRRRLRDAPRRRPPRRTPARRAPRRPRRTPRARPASGARRARGPRTGSRASCSVSTQCSIVSQSEAEPMITATCGFIATPSSSATRGRRARSCAARRPPRPTRRSPRGSGACPVATVPFFRQMTARRRTALFGSRAASSCSSGRNALMSPGCVRESPSSAISDEPRAAGLSSSSPRRSSSSFWRNRNCAIARYACARTR